MPALKPMSTSDVLDGTFHLYRQQFLTLFLTVLPVFCAVHAAQLLFYFSSRGLRGNPEAVAVAGLVSGAVVLPISLFGVTLINGIVTMIASGHLLGVPVGPGGALRWTLSRFLPLLWTTILFTIFMFLLTLLCVVPGLIYFVNRCLYVQVVLLEGKSGLVALRRAKKLMRHRAGPGLLGRADVRAGIFFLFLMMIGMTAGVATQAPTFFLAAFYGSNITDTLAIPPVWMVSLTIATMLISAAVQPIGFICFVLFYYDLRIRGEAFGQEQPAASPATS